MKKPLPFNLVIVSPPGGGKSTQSKMLKPYFSFNYVMTGDLVRALASRDAKVKERMLKGKSQPDSVIVKAIKQELKHKPPLIIDTLLSIPQIKSFEEKVKNNVYLLSLEVSDREVKKRLLIRAKKEKRLDDAPAIIKKRILEYKKLLRPLKSYFGQNRKLLEINGNHSPVKVNQLIVAQLKKL